MILTLIRILAVLHVLVASSALVAGFVFCAKTWLSTDPASVETLQFFGPAFLLFGVPVLMPELVGGIGLLLLKPWARIVMIVVSAVYLIAFPYGTPVGAFGLGVLLSSKGRLAFGERAAAATSEALRRPRSATTGLLLTMGALAAGFFIVLWIGFSLDDRPAPAPFAGRLPVAVAIIAGFAAVVGLVPVVRRAAAVRDRRRSARRTHAAYQRDRAARIAMLAADPVRHTYALRMEKGEAWSDEQIAYDEDRRRLATCMHLQPIERSMREAGIEVRLTGPSAIRANCRIDRAGLERRSLLSAPAEYWNTSLPTAPPRTFPLRMCAARSAVQ